MKSDLAEESPQSQEGGAAGDPQIARFGAVAGRTRLSLSITTELVEAIVRGEIPPGTPLPPEKDLAADFDVSRQVIRDATSQLAALGLIARRQGRASRVAPRDSWNDFAPEVLAARRASGEVDEMLLNLLEFRRMIEPEAAWLAARRRDESDLVLLRDQMALMDRCVAEDSRDQFIETDLAFHEAILRSTKNQLLPSLFRQLQVVLAFAREMSPYAQHDALLRSQRGHEAILAALQASDAELARKAMVDHLSWTATLGAGDSDARPAVQTKSDPA
jgi:DNA-binding FadR family transcriptional regulator